jgi:hypothetical protein
MAMTPESLAASCSVTLPWELKEQCLLDGAADAAVSDFHPLRDLLAVLVDRQWLFDVRRWSQVSLMAELCRAVPTYSPQTRS